MSKSKKKRAKKYTGQNAKINDHLVRVHRLSAVHRPAWRQWLFDHKKSLRYGFIIAVVGSLFVLLIVQGIIGH
jgi:hypothetical protein